MWVCVWVWELWLAGQHAWRSGPRRQQCCEQLRMRVLLQLLLLHLLLLQLQQRHLFLQCARRQGCAHCVCRRCAHFVCR